MKKFLFTLLPILLFALSVESSVDTTASKVRWKPLNTYRTINAVELSTMTFEDAMAFVGADYALAA